MLSLPSPRHTSTLPTAAGMRKYPPFADYDEAARVKRYDVARDSGMMPPTVTE
jgi:hypothetical protein